MFDSGIGGISVFREIKQQLPSISIDYLFDNAFYPYGQLSEKQLVERITSLISNVVEKEAPALVVIACNSASTAALPALRERLTIPVVGVVPAIKPAANHSKNNAIGLLATEGTVNRSYITALINDYASDCSVVKIGSNELVEMAELAYRGIAPSLVRLAQICAPFNNSVDTIVLGCTHFPLLSSYITQVTSDQIRLVDSGRAIANRVSKLLESRQTKTPNQRIDRALYTKPNLDEPLIAGLEQEGFNQINLIS